MHTVIKLTIIQFPLCFTFYLYAFYIVRAPQVYYVFSVDHSMQNLLLPDRLLPVTSIQ